jgi:hypothetical protein
MKNGTGMLAGCPVCGADWLEYGPLGDRCLAGHVRVHPAEATATPGANGHAPVTAPPTAPLPPGIGPVPEGRGSAAVQSPAPVAIPPLPDAATPDAARVEEGGWVDDYARFAESRSPMTPRAFHTSAALWLCALAIARRLKVPMPFGDVYPNLAVVWIAETTLYRKTTALDVARDLARRELRHLLLPQESSPEALLADMAGQEPARFNELPPASQAEWRAERDYAAQRGLLLDELSGLLAGAGRDYNAGLIETFLRFFDCDPSFVRSTRGQGRVTVRNAYLSVLAAGTPAGLAPHIEAERLWALGWWPRCALLVPAARPEWREPAEMEEPPDLGRALRSLAGRLPAATWPEPPRALSVGFAPDAFELWRAYNKAVSFDLLADGLDARLYGTYGRLPTQVLKVATCLAALRWGDAPVPVIDMGVLGRAVGIAEEWRAGAHRALGLSASGERDRKLERVLYQAARFEPEGASIRDIARGLRDIPREAVVELVKVGVAAGELYPIEQAAGTKGGRSTTRYHVGESNGQREVVAGAPRDRPGHNLPRHSD